MLAPTLAFLVYAAGIASAAPTGTDPSSPTNIDTSKLAIVPAIPNANYAPDAHRALIKAYNKYSMPIPTSVAELVDSLFTPPSPSLSLGVSKLAVTAQKLPQANAAQVSAKTYNSDVSWLSPTLIDGKTFYLDYDTGSSDLWVYADPSTAPAKHNTYDCSHATPGYTWEIDYLDKSNASGTVAFGEVSIGGLVVKNQAVECAINAIGLGGAGDKSDGVLGLSFGGNNRVSPTKQAAWLDNAGSQGAVASGMFTVDLYHGDVNPSSYTFGTCLCDAPEWVNIDSSLSDKWYAFPGVNGNPAIADTGTTLLLLQQEFVKYYYTNVTGAYYSAGDMMWVFPCSSITPDLYLPVVDKHIKIPGNLMVFSKKGEVCYGSVQQTGEGAGPQVYGDIMFKAITACFDKDGVRFGWCPKGKLGSLGAWGKVGAWFKDKWARLKMGLKKIF